MAQKIYLLDTNVLVYDPQSIYAFEGANLGIPITVLEELDSFKSESNSRGRNAREVNRILDKLRNVGCLRDGVPLENGGTLKIIFPEENIVQAAPFLEKNGDNDILKMALGLKNLKFHVVFISKDLNARVKADVIGIEAHDYLKGRITQDQFYQGWKRVQVPAVQLKREFPDILKQLAEEKKLTRNEFILVESNNNPFNHSVFRYLGFKKFKKVDDPIFAWPMQARNPQQLMALDLLLDPEVQLITLFGQAGTGKTFLALLAGLHQSLINDEYSKMLISRPVIPLGKDIGYLPGDIHEKLHSWMLPIYDNIEFIVHHASAGNHMQQVAQDLHNNYKHEKNKKDKHGNNRKHRKKHKDMLPGGLAHVDDLIRRGKLSLEAITYMRGRSIPYQFILIDEVQNLTPHEIKTLISRVGDGSKIILAGDPYQIDSPHLDFSSNGLVVVSERFKGQRLFGSVYLQNSERSELSDLATKLL
ncbi:PhoH family protein [bacterium]|nr:PhoH family protein [bacterium]